MSTPELQAPMSQADFLAMERASQIKHELWNGEAFATTGGTLAHAALSMSIGAALVGALRGRGCRVLSADARVHVPLSRGFVYPDVTVVCGPMQTWDEVRDVLLNPTVVVEVLSESTERFDRGEKFAGYRSIASLGDYVLASQQERQIEVYSRQDGGGWLLRAYRGDDAVPLPSLGVELSMVEVYQGVLDAPGSA